VSLTPVFDETAIKMAKFRTGVRLGEVLLFLGNPTPILHKVALAAGSCSSTTGYICPTFGHSSPV